LIKREHLKGFKSDIRSEVLAQLKSDKVDQEKLNNLFNEKEASFREMHVFLVLKFAEFQAILTREQRSKLAEIIEKHHPRFGHGGYVH